MNKEELTNWIETIFKEEQLILAVFSAPFKNIEIKKATVRPIKIKNKIFFQLSLHSKTQVFHRNLNSSECQKWVTEQVIHYKQAMIDTDLFDYQLLISKKQTITLLKKNSSKQPQLKLHNRQKNHYLEEGKPLSFLVQLGIMTAEGKIIAKKSHKFFQINRFLELAEETLSQFEKDQKIVVIDFGCGKGYLTFALYYYLTFIKQLKVEMIGLDLKADVIEKCQQVAKDLGYHQLHFKLGDIYSYHSQQKIDMVIALHACNTATDAALQKAVEWQSKAILCAPCCQSELYQQVKNPALTPLLKHGILKERFAALATDALRAQLLEVLGYKAQVVEFIEIDHTPKNLLIRAVKSSFVKKEQAWKLYKEMKEILNVEPMLEKLLKKELAL